MIVIDSLEPDPRPPRDFARSSAASSAHPRSNDKNNKRPGNQTTT